MNYENAKGNYDLKQYRLKKAEGEMMSTSFKVSSLNSLHSIKETKLLSSHLESKVLKWWLA